jgi:CrcB protein
MRRLGVHADVLACIAVGGALGTLARWSLGELFPHDSSEFPWNTFLANVSGALLIGVLMAFLLEVQISRRYVRPFLGVGVLGGYTTFSTYMLDTRNLLVADRPAHALGYLAGTLILGLAAVMLGAAATRATLARAVRRVGHEVSEDPSPAPTKDETR